MAEPRRVLILGGTGEAVSLAQRLAGLPGLNVITSLAGRTRAPRLPAGLVRRGGFGGAGGLAGYLRMEAIDAVVDATHPYAARISAHAATACAELGVPRLILRRLPWPRQPGDRWIDVSDSRGAARALPSRGRVLLAIGHAGLDAFSARCDVWFLVRLIESPRAPSPFPRHEIVVGRGPFELDDEIALLRDHRIDAVVSKNSGGAATYGKIEAARALGLPVIMIARPPEVPGQAVATVDAAEAWLRSRIAPSGA